MCGVNYLLLNSFLQQLAILVNGIFKLRATDELLNFFLKKILLKITLEIKSDKYDGKTKRTVIDTSSKSM